MIPNLSVLTLNSALEVNFNVIHSTNSPVTYLLTKYVKITTLVIQYRHV